MEGDSIGLQGCSILGIGHVYCVLETLYIRLEVGDVLLKVVCMGVVNRSGVRFLFDSSMFEANFLTDLLQEAHQLSIRIGICEVVLALCKGNSIVVCLGLSYKKCLFQIRLEPKDEIINLLLFRQLQMACEGIEVIDVRF